MLFSVIKETFIEIVRKEDPLRDDVRVAIIETIEKVDKVISTMYPPSTTLENLIVTAKQMVVVIMVFTTAHLIVVTDAILIPPVVVLIIEHLVVGMVVPQIIIIEQVLKTPCPLSHIKVGTIDIVNQSNLSKVWS